MKGRAYRMLALLALVGCAAQPWHKSSRRAAQHTYSKRTYALTRSYYAAQMYDDNERYLLSERASSEVSHRVSLRGAPLHPPAAIAIVPAGTPVVLERIEFPTRWATLHRMMTSPVQHIWLRLRPAPGATLPLLDTHTPWTIVLPDGISHPQALHDAVVEVLGAPEAIAAWLASVSPAVRTGISHKVAVIGMDERALVAALGPPLAWRTVAGVQGALGKLAMYEKDRITLLGGLVADIASNAGGAINAMDALIGSPPP